MRLRRWLQFKHKTRRRKGGDLSTLASLRALWARTPEPAWARRAVGEGVKFCPRADAGNLPVRFDERGGENGAMVEPVRHRRTKGRQQICSNLKLTASHLDSTLFGRDAMSDLSPDPHQKRTFANAFDPRKKVGRGEVNSRAP